MTLRDELDKLSMSDPEKHRGKVIALAYTYPHSIEQVVGAGGCDILFRWL